MHTPFSKRSMQLVTATCLSAIFTTQMACGQDAALNALDAQLSRQKETAKLEVLASFADDLAVKRNQALQENKADEAKALEEELTKLQADLSNGLDKLRIKALGEEDAAMEDVFSQLQDDEPKPETPVAEKSTAEERKQEAKAAKEAKRLPKVISNAKSTGYFFAANTGEFDKSGQPLIEKNPRLEKGVAVTWTLGGVVPAGEYEVWVDTRTNSRFDVGRASLYVGEKRSDKLSFAFPAKEAGNKNKACGKIHIVDEATILRLECEELPEEVALHFNLKSLILTTNEKPKAAEKPEKKPAPLPF